MLVGLWLGFKRVLTRWPPPWAFGVFVPLLLIALLKLFGHVNSLLPSNL
jgi:hypothetical protein